ncbi:MAG: FAD-binding oxidoreductase [Amaricoccus sp.]
MTIALKGLDGGTRQIAESTADALARGLKGSLVRIGEPGYEEARTVWNGMIDRRPGLVVRAAAASDVVATVDFAREHGVLMSIRGGGHQIGGLAVADGALMLDLSAMRSIEVDPGMRTARVGPGATLAELDAATQAHGLAVPVGINSTTGIAGLTLGGGFGWITRKFGLTVDNLRAAEVVTADGTLRRASAEQNPELFWALKGGGGNFGVVTSFDFRLHPVGPEVVSGLLIHPIEAAPEILREFRRICAEAPDELTTWAVVRKAPPAPFIPEAWHGNGILVLATCYAGSVEDGERAVAALRALGEPIVDLVGPKPFAAWQQALDPLLAPGARNYWKSHDFVELSDAAIGVILDAAGRLPDPQTEIAIAHLGGAMARVASDATPFPQRKAHFTMNVHARWDDPGKDMACIGWARALFDAAAPHSAGSVYVNFIPADEPDRLVAAYGGNLERLRRAKAMYDADNLFRCNHNIRPTALAHAAE